MNYYVVLCACRHSEVALSSTTRYSSTSLRHRYGTKATKCSEALLLAGKLASNDEERPERGGRGRETVGGKSTLDADWALHLRSFPPAYNGLNKNRAISIILASSDGLYVFRGHYVLADLCIRCTEQTETSFFRLEAAVHYIKTFFSFLAASVLLPQPQSGTWLFFTQIVLLMFLGSLAEWTDF